MFETDWSEEWGIYFLFSNSRSTGVSDMWAQFPALHSSCLTPFFCPLLFLSYLPSLFTKSLHFLVCTLTNPTLQRGWGSPGCKTLWASNSMFAVDILWFFSSPFHRGFSSPFHVGCGRESKCACARSWAVFCKYFLRACEISHMFLISLQVCGVHMKNIAGSSPGIRSE